MDKKIEKRPSFLAAMFVFLFLIFAMAAQIFIIKNNDIAHWGNSGDSSGCIHFRIYLGGYSGWNNAWS